MPSSESAGDVAEWLLRLVQRFFATPPRFFLFFCLSLFSCDLELLDLLLLLLFALLLDLLGPLILLREGTEDDRELDLADEFL